MKRVCVVSLLTLCLALGWFASRLDIADEVVAWVLVAVAALNVLVARPMAKEAQTLRAVLLARG